MKKQQTVNDRAVRIESKLTRFIEEQQELNRRLARMLDQWDEFKQEWDEEGLDGEDTGFNGRDAKALSSSLEQRRAASG